MKIKKIFPLFLFILIFQSCSTMSSFTSIPPGAKVEIGKAQVIGTTPFSGKISNTTFGTYPVKVQKDGYETIYSNLPLKVRGRNIALSAIFFAPAAFFSVQNALPFYEFDLEKSVIRYKIKRNSEWLIYETPDNQKDAVRSFFED